MARGKKERVALYLRVILLVLEVVMLLIGIAIIGVAISFQVQNGVLYAVLPTVLSQCLLFQPGGMVISVFALVMAAIGMGLAGVYCSRRRPGKIVLAMHGVILACTMLILLSASIFYWAELELYDERIVMCGQTAISMTSKQGSEGELFQAWNTLQKKDQCCGSEGLKDWFNVTFPDKNPKDPNNTVPVSCCDPSQWSDPSDCTGVNVTGKGYFHKGCATVISSHFVSTTNIIAGLSLVWSIVQATAVVLTLTVMLLLRDILLDYGTVL